MSSQDIVKSFLLCPEDKRAFNRLYEYSREIARTYIRKLIASGWKYPIEEADYEKNLEQITIRHLEAFFESSVDRPFFRIFDYYRRHKLGITCDSDSSRIDFHYRILLTGFIKRYYRIYTREDDPQLANFKRRIREILKSEEFIIIKYQSDEIVYLKKHENNLRPDGQNISSEYLLGLIIEQYYNATSYVNLCHSVFMGINELVEYRNFIIYQNCMNTFVLFYHQYLKPDQCYSVPPHTPELYRIRALAQKAVEYSYEKTGENELREFMKKGRIKKEELPLYEKALKNYLEDFGFDGRTDSLPQYIYEQFPDIDSGEYQKKHKYLFDTIIDGARNYFIDFMKRSLRNMNFVPIKPVADYKED